MTFLEQILLRKRDEVKESRARVPEDALRARLHDLEPVRGLHAALSPPGGPMRIIAEVKRASPSVGTINAEVDAPTLAQRYASAGAAAVSVLTDGPGFGRSLADLKAVRAAVNVPVLRKDFIIDGYQLLEARCHGADAALLIVAALDQPSLEGLVKEARAIDLEPLVEVHDEAEVDRALAAGAKVVGINNRDLRTFKVDLGVSERLISKLPSDVRAVAESGVKGEAEARRLRAGGAANLLVGEALVRAPDPADLLRVLTRV